MLATVSKIGDGKFGMAGTINLYTVADSMQRYDTVDIDRL